MRLLIDMDDVIADTLNYTIACLESNNIIIDRKELAGKELEDILTKEQVDFMHKMTDSVSYFKRIPIKPNCYAVLKELHKRYEIRVVSCAFAFPNSMNAKLGWLKKHLDFISLNEIIFCGCKADIKGDIMIDDRTENLQKFSGRKYLYTAPHNKGINRYKRFNSWIDIQNEFCR